MTYYSRDAWGARPARGGPGPLTSSRVEGVALHWPAMAKPLRGVEEVSAALRGWQSYHMDGRGWSDIAYQEAFDQDGNVYHLRGIRTQSGANGDTDVNERFGAFLLVLAPGEKPTRAMKRAVRRRVKKFREVHERADRIVGHGQIRPGGTTCPGPITQSMIERGVFEPQVVERALSRGKHVDDAIASAQKAARIAKGKRHTRRRTVLRDAIDILKNLKAR